jgi:hypothetical protein
MKGNEREWLGALVVKKMKSPPAERIKCAPDSDSALNRSLQIWYSFSDRISRPGAILQRLP